MVRLSDWFLVFSLRFSQVKFPLWTSSTNPTSPCVSGLELPFMMMPHPLIPVSLPPASVTMAMSQMNHLSTIANMAAAAQGQSLPSRMVTSVIKVDFNTERFNVFFRFKLFLTYTVAVYAGYLFQMCFCGYWGCRNVCRTVPPLLPL